MQVFVFMFFVTLVVAYARNTIENNWNTYKEVFHKFYNKTEDERRHSIWEDNVRAIKKHNSQYNAGFHNYSLKVNDITDRSLEEMHSSTHHCLKPHLKISNGTHKFNLSALYDDLPRHVDWRRKGLVTPVRNQMKPPGCPCCWAFVAAAAIEGQWKKHTGKLVTLSVQNLIDCCLGNFGCKGGDIDNAFDYVVKNGGIDNERSYPYTAKQGECRFDKKFRGATIKGYVDVPTGDENALKKAVATVGPIAAGVNAKALNFHHLGKEIYDDPSCSSDDLNHAVLIVGYGTENGKDYWLIKNSWGKNWGDNGYGRMARNKNNQCGIATLASYPVMK